MNKEKYMILGIMIFLVVSLSITAIAQFPGDLTTTGKPIYRYTYAFPQEINNCDIHWLRMSIQYETNILPIDIYIAGTEVVIGFDKELSKAEDAQVNSTITRGSETCFKPSGVVYKFTMRVNPEEFQDQFATVSTNKPIYYSDGENVTLYLYQVPNIFEGINIRNQLCNMWEESTI